MVALFGRIYSMYFPVQKISALEDVCQSKALLPKYQAERCHMPEGRLKKMRVFYVRFEVFMAMTMKNDVFWDVTPCFL
jgi:hypothetical protein